MLLRSAPGSRTPLQVRFVRPPRPCIGKASFRESHRSLYYAVFTAETIHSGSLSMPQYRKEIPLTDPNFKPNVGETVLYQGHQVTVLKIDKQGRVIEYKNPAFPNVDHFGCLSGIHCYPITPEAVSLQSALRRSIDQMKQVRVDSLAIDKLIWTALAENGSEYAQALAAWLDTLWASLINPPEGNPRIFMTLENTQK